MWYSDVGSRTTSEPDDVDGVAFSVEEGDDNEDEITAVDCEVVMEMPEMARYETTGITVNIDEEDVFLPKELETNQVTLWFSDEVKQPDTKLTKTIPTKQITMSHTNTSTHLCLFLPKMCTCLVRVLLGSF